MKKRIIASTMASVMALSAGTSLMASAAVADFKTQSVSKADLRKLIEDKEIVDLVDNDGVSQYGSVSGATFLTAVDFAKAVLEDVESTNDQATVAYLMVKAAKDNLKQYTKEELQLLVSECRGKYDSNNILNERGDARYTDATWSKFKEAFEEADDYKEYDDILVTTDAYEKLDAAKNPEELKTKTKAQIDAARRNYEKALQMEFKYQPWIRGTVTAAKTDYDGKQFAWGILYAHIKSGQNDTMQTYDTFDKIKGLNVTSDPVIVAAVDALEQAATVLNGFSASYEIGSSQSSVNKLLSDYHGQLVYTYNAATAISVLADFVAKAGNGAETKVEVKMEDKWVTEGDTLSDGSTTVDYDAVATSWNTKLSTKTTYQPLGSNGGKTAEEVRKLIKAELVIRTTSAGKDVYYIADNNNKLANGNGAIYGGADGATYFYTSEADAKAAAGTGMQVKKIKKESSITISDWISVAGEMVAADSDFGPASTPSMTGTDALANLKTLGGKIDDALVSLQSAVDGATAAVAALASSTTVDLAGGKILEADLDAISDAADALTGAMDDLTTASAKFTDGSATKAEVKELGTLYAAVGTKISALAAAVNAVSGTGTLQGKAAMTTALTQMKKYGDSSGTTVKDTALDKWFGTDKTHYTKVAEAWLATYNAKLIDAIDAAMTTPTTATANTITAKTAVPAFKANNVVDVAGEVAFNSGKGIKFDRESDSTNDFTLTNAYVSDRTNTTGKVSSITTPNLARAMVMFENFGIKSWGSIEALDNTMYIPGEIKEGTAVQSRAWNMLYTYMKYALEDEFSATAAKTYTLKDVKKLLDDAYVLSTDTVETALFNTSHMNLFTDRNGASSWVKLAEANGSGEKYKDNDTAYDVVTTAGDNSYNSTTMWEKLNGTYKQLNNELSAFKYSYGEIVTQMALIAKRIDAGDFSADVKDKLTKDLMKTAGEFVKVEAVMTSAGDELEDSGLFNANGTINVHNRLFTNGAEFSSLKTVDGDVKIARSNKAGDKNETHYNMQVAYEQLIKDYEAATKAPEVKIDKDVNGDKTFNLQDVVALLKLNVDGKMDVNKHDFNGDKKADLQDVVALLKQYTNS